MIEELCKRLLNFRRENGTLSGAECQLTMEAATLIRRLVAERDDAHEEAYTTDDDGQSVTWHELYEAERSIRQYNQRRVTAAEAEVERLRAALKDATAHLAAATSSYRRFCRKGVTGDALFSTKLSDYQKATNRARTALEGKNDGK